jgi:hypothetical protein
MSPFTVSVDAITSFPTPTVAALPMLIAIAPAAPPGPTVVGTSTVTT